MKKIEVLLSLALLAIPVAASAESDNWPSFRGPEALNVGADDPRLPETWTTSENIKWKQSIPGLGWSSPVVWEDRVFVTTVVSDGEIEEPKKGLYFGGNRPDPSKDQHHWVVLALDTGTGDVIWKTAVKSGAPRFPRHLKNTYASETPVTDGEKIFAYFGNEGLYALDFDGNVVWERSSQILRTRYGWGMAASPILHGDQLFVVNDNEDMSYFAAVDKNTGEELWRATRPDEGSNWATPFVWQNELRTRPAQAWVAWRWSRRRGAAIWRRRCCGG